MKLLLSTTTFKSNGRSNFLERKAPSSIVLYFPVKNAPLYLLGSLLYMVSLSYNSIVQATLFGFEQSVSMSLVVCSLLVIKGSQQKSRYELKSSFLGCHLPVVQVITDATCSSSGLLSIISMSNVREYFMQLILYIFSTKWNVVLFPTGDW